ncbi:FAD-dependent oxidoreductase [Rhodococcus aetherivorans]
MAYVITQNCCNDAACVAACPVNCIHPTPDEPGFATAEILYIDPKVCIDCGACFDTCPVGAIYPDYELPESYSGYLDLNAAYFDDSDRTGYDQNSAKKRSRLWSSDEQLDEVFSVAIVGAGPAGFYAAQELLGQRGLAVKVDMFEKLPVPGGLARYGVAPDHQGTKAVLDIFTRIMQHDSFRMFGNVEIGRDLSHEQLTDRYHAVIYAVGSMSGRALNITGEDLGNSISATEFVGWYNGHPSFTSVPVDLSCTRAVIIGNGNVALDVARVLSAGVDVLHQTDISDAALEALSASQITEVIVVGRRGPSEAAFTTPELMGLDRLTNVNIAVSPDELTPSPDSDTLGQKNDPIAAFKRNLLAQFSTRTATSSRTITLRFLRTPIEILGEDTVTGIRLRRNELALVGNRMEAVPTHDFETIDCGMVIRAVGFRGTGIPGLPFDEQRAVIPQSDGRVIDPQTDEVLTGVYVTGWIKRGPSGVIGTNKKCAQDTVSALLNDYSSGLLSTPRIADDVAHLVPESVDVRGWRAIDRHEQTTGRGDGRPRIKLLEVRRMLEIASGAS